LPSVYSNGPGVGTKIYTWFHCTCWKARSAGSSTGWLTGPLSLLLWTLLSRGFFLKVGVPRALSRRTVTAARGPALIVPSVDGFGVILRFACALRHAENIISASHPRHSSPMRARARTLTDSCPVPRIQAMGTADTGLWTQRAGTVVPRPELRPHGQIRLRSTPSHA
jgi:hypothetical protein